MDVTTAQTGMLEEAPGVKSSKRFAGFVMIGAGCALLGGTGILALIRPVADPQTALAAGTTLVSAGAALLGSTILEGLGNRIGGAR